PQAIEPKMLYLCHSKEYVALVQKECQTLGQESLALLSTGDVVICPESFDVALLAAGAVVEAIDCVMSGKAKRAFAIVRPPGHHATRDCGMGFCLFNNVAVGARYVQQKYGISRVAIIDWDLHHGNGTEDIFFDDSSVLYCSTHQAGIYPNTGWHSSDTIINCP